MSTTFFISLRPGTNPCCVIETQSAAPRSRAIRKMEAKIRFVELTIDYSAENRIRQRIARWKLPGLSITNARNILRAFHYLAARTPQKVLANAIRVVFNGWPTDERMKGVINRRPQRCVLCGNGADAIAHYAYCDVYWKFAMAQPPVGLGLNASTHRSLANFLLACKPAATVELLGPRMIDL